MFQISLENFFKTKTYLLYHLRLQPSEVEQLPYYEFEYIVRNLIDILKEKQEAEEKEMNGDENSQMSKMMDNAKGNLPSSVRGAMNGGTPSMPSMKMPSISNFPGIPASMKI